MRHRMLLLGTVVVIGIVLAAAGLKVGVAAAPEPAVAMASPAPTCGAEVLQASSSLPDVEPVPSCGGCPTMTTCFEEFQACGCPTGPGHCEFCPSGSGFKCVKN